MNLDTIKNYINHPELLDDRSINELKTIVEEFPFFQSAHLLLLKNLHNQGDIRYEKELKKTAVWTTDRKKLFYLLDDRVLLSVDDKTNDLNTNNQHKSATTSIKQKEQIKGTEHSDYVIKESKIEKPKMDELDELILSGSAVTGTFFNVDDQVDLASFKNTFGKKKDPIENNNKKDKPTDRRNTLIDNFIVNKPKIAKPEEQKRSEEPTDLSDKSPSSDMITDTLAQIYIKQGFYEKAINAYEKLSLKYPEKNIYFADQIKKIKKNINN